MPSVQRFTHSFTVLLGSAGTTDVAFLSYDPNLSRVRVDQSVLATVNGSPPPAGATRIVERSSDLIRWTAVRGGAEAPVDSTAIPVDDYEFDANTQDTYRMRVLVGGVLYWTLRDQITVSVDTPWLKSLRFPFLNQEISPSTADPITRPTRSGMFNVVGRSLPVAVTDVRASGAYTLTIATTTTAGADSVRALFSTGDVVFLQVPVGYPVPGGYYCVGDVTEDRQGVPWDRRWWSLPLTEVNAPAAAITGAVMTWRALGNLYPAWSDVIAGNATWGDVLQLQGTPGDVVVS